MLSRLEGPLLFGFTFAWIVVLLEAAGQPFLAGRLPLGLYHFFSFASVLGWLAGNFFVSRRRLHPAADYRSYLYATWLGGPPALLFLLQACQPLSSQQAQPFVRIWGLCVFLLFFGIPVSLDRRVR